jgi:hypothetical protein
MKKLFMALLFVCVLTPVANSADYLRSCFPQLALGGGYEAVVIVTNVSDHTWTGAFRPYRGANVPWQGYWAVDGVDQTSRIYAPISLYAKQTKKFRFTGNPSSTNSGYLDITQSSNDVGYAHDLAISYFYEYRAGDGSLMDSIGSFPPTPAYRWAFPVEKTKVMSTGLAAAPFYRDTPLRPWSINFTLYDQTGAVARQGTSTASGHFAVLFEQLFTDLPENFTGFLYVNSSAPILMTVLRLELTPTGFQLTSSPAWTE